MTTRTSFDHRLAGIIAAERNDSGELLIIIVQDNEVSTTTVVPGSWDW